MNTYKIYWDIFETTGNLEAYLIYKDLNKGTNSDNNTSERYNNKRNSSWRI